MAVIFYADVTTNNDPKIELFKKSDGEGFGLKFHRFDSDSSTSPPVVEKVEEAKKRLNKRLKKRLKKK